ncbi:histidyl-tRNA synthetase, partial [Tremellales sp. Uapishka_1]
MSTTADTSVADRIAVLQTQIKQLKVSKQDASKELEEMKALKELQGKDKQKEAGTALSLKTPKGTMDHKPAATLLRKKIFNTLESIFVKHGASTIDTPVFELKEILAGKYGEDSKLIYDLQDQGGELCSLRYDLTVPFARYLAMNGITSMKRFHIGKVYRRDQPVMSKGRMREFYQCVRSGDICRGWKAMLSRSAQDFDIAGTYDPMVPDAEVLCVVCEALTALDIGEFVIKVRLSQDSAAECSFTSPQLNHRKILDGIFELAGVPADKTRTISSAVDKLDKLSWEEVKKEMTVEKGLDPEVADRIGEYVKLKGPGLEILARLQGDAKLMSIPSAKAGLADMELLFSYLEIYGVLDKMSFDMSLARGLDYYTGIIYEAIHAASAAPTPAAIDSKSAPRKSKKDKSKDKDKEDEVDESAIGVGSIAAGGRYDNLVNMFSEAAGNKREQVPCVGVSVGVERVYSIMEMRRKGDTKIRGKETEVFVLSLGEGLLKERMAVAKMLWDSGIKAEFTYKAKPKVPAQWKTADEDQVPFVIILAPTELQNGTVRIKAQVGKDEAGEDKGEEVKMADVVGWLKERLAV